MSKASAWVQRRNSAEVEWDEARKRLTCESSYGTLATVTEDGLCDLMSKRVNLIEALHLAHWLIDTFADAPKADKETT